LRPGLNECCFWQVFGLRGQRNTAPSRRLAPVAAGPRLRFGSACRVSHPLPRRDRPGFTPDSLL